MNRLTHKGYTDGIRSQFYSYDGNDEYGHPLSGVPAAYGQNAIGHLSHTSDEISIASISAYDPMGRLILKSDCLPSNCSPSYLLSATYDLAGNIITFTYPDGRAVNDQYDSAGRAKSIGMGAATQTYLQSVLYNPDGTPSMTTLGNGVVETTVENNRL